MVRGAARTIGRMRCDPDVERLLGRGGWELDDVQARYRQYPDTFWLPDANDLARLAPSHHVLVTWHERMWLWVEETGEEELVGVLMSLPLSSHTAPTAGARVRFRRTDVIDLELEPPGSMQDELERLARIGFPVCTLEQGLEPVDPTRRRKVSESQQRVCDAAGGQV